MFDFELLELCRDCLIGAVLAASGEEDLVLVATALSRDLSDAHGPHAHDLLTASARDAASSLDASDLTADGFAAALSRLAWLKQRTAQALPVAAPVAL